MVTKPIQAKWRSLAVDLNTFIVAVFCLIDDRVKDRRIRRRGPAPKLSDSEVLTMEIVGEFLGIDTYTRPSSFSSADTTLSGSPLWVPRSVRSPSHHLRPPSRQSLEDKGDALEAPARPGALRWRGVLDRQRQLPGAYLPLCQGLPLPKVSRRLAEESAFGYDEMSKQTFYGLRAHLRVCWPGIIVEMDLAPANVHDLRLAEHLLEGAKEEGWVLGGRNYWSPELSEKLGEEGLSLLAPYKSKKKEKQRWPGWLV
jgi:Transposase DDE domain